jgi:hypothetical protein
VCVLGLVETLFTRGELSITIIDVGGQRSERRKWLHCFDDVDGVAFVVGMSEYDQILSDDATTNRMQESIKVFGQICYSRWFRTTPMLLFLNKKDVFEEKIVYSPITKCFPEYNGTGESDDAANYIQQQFRDKNPSHKREVYCHFTNAKDAQNVNFLFDIIVDIILHSNMDRLGME